MNNENSNPGSSEHSDNQAVAGANQCWNFVTSVVEACACVLFCGLYIAQEELLDPLQRSYRNYTRRKSTRRRPMNPKCQHLPRKRLLTNELPPVHASQECCSLLKLPWEIRSMIYHQVLGGKRVHFDMVDKKFFRNNGPVCYFCREDSPRFGPVHQECAVHWSGRRTAEQFLKKMIHSENMLYLLQTCRQIYSEGVNIMYTSNIMQPCSIESLLSLQQIMLPQRLQLIQWLEVEMRPDIFIPKDDRVSSQYVPPIAMEQIEYNTVNHEEFKKAWDLLANMPNLRVLRVDLYFVTYSRGWWDYIQPSLEETISRVSSPQIFEVYLDLPLFVQDDDLVYWGSAKILGKREFDNHGYRLNRGGSYPPARPRHRH